MRQGSGLLGLGLVAVLLQGTLATLVPPHGLPDLAFLVVVGMAIAVGGVESLIVACLVGYTLDLLSGALLGQHALLLVLACAATRVANLQLNLMRTVPRIAFIAGLTVAIDLGHAGIARLFAGSAGADWTFLRQVAIHAGVNAVFAPAVLALVQRAAGVLGGEEDAYRRPLRVQPRGRLSG